MTINVPDWCIIGKYIAWSDENTTGAKWVRERIVGYTPTGFLHQASNCPMYHTNYTEYGKTVKELDKVKNAL